MSFDNLGLAPEILAAINAAGYSEPTPIQAQAIPHILGGKDVLGIAQTGTGKTAGFTLPMIHRLMRGRAKARMPRSLILEPTRELAAQVAESFATYGKNTKLTKALLIGGVSFADQEQAIMRGADVLIATPGRLLDHIERGGVLLRGVEVLVIDEADRMLDMGFIPDIEKIVGLVPFTRQTLFFSATMPDEITRLSEKFLSAPVRVEAAPPASTNANVAQHLVTTSPRDKRQTLRQLFERETVTNGIIFCNRKRDIGDLLKSLQQHNYQAVSLHGDMDQYMRLKMLDRFKNGEATYLIASDVAARGLDIPNVSHVFNFDVPTHAEDYVHRIGRTGRAGRNGTAFTLVTRESEKYIAAIETLIGQKIPPYGKVPASPSAIDEKANKPEHSPKPNKPNSAKQGGQRRGLLDKGKHENKENQNATATTEKPVAEKPKSEVPAPDKKATPKQEGAFGGNVPAFMQNSTKSE